MGSANASGNRAGGRVRPVTSAHVEHLGIVQQVLNRSLRLFRPHRSSFATLSMTSNWTVLFSRARSESSRSAIHRHRSYWDDDRFDPNRFARDSRSKPTRFRVMPFGAGPRICIGAAFTMIEATIMLATFVRAGHLRSAPISTRSRQQMFLLPENGMPMRVTLRGSAR